MPSSAPIAAAAQPPDCNFAYVVPTTLSNLTNIADAIFQSTQLSANLLSPLPTAWSPSRHNNGPRTQLPAFLLPRRNASHPSTNFSDGNATAFISSLDNFDLFDVPFATSGHTWLHIILSTLIVVAMMIVIIFGNALVIVAVQADKSLKGIQNYFIVSLAVADLLVGLTIMPLSLAVELMGKWIFGPIACNLWLGGDVLLCTASILNLCMISIDRYWSVTLAGLYTARVRKHRVTIMIVLVWILSAIISIPPLVGVARRRDAREDECELMDDLWYIIYSTFGSFYAPLVVMIVVYIRIFVIARRTARKSAFKLTKQLQKKRNSLRQQPPSAQLQDALNSCATDLARPNGENEIPVEAKDTAENDSDRLTLRAPVNGHTNADLSPGSDDSFRKIEVKPKNGGIDSKQSPGRFRLLFNDLVMLKYFRRGQRQQMNSPREDAVAFSLLDQNQQAKPPILLKDGPHSRSMTEVDEDMSVRSAHGNHLSQLRSATQPVISNDHAIHEASSMLGNVAMTLAVVPREANARTSLLQSLADVQQTVVAPISTDKPTSLGKTMSEAVADRSTAAVEVDYRRCSQPPKLAESSSRQLPSNLETIVDSSHQLSYVKPHPAKKEPNVVPALSLAEEVERRKKRLAKERERRTTRILVIIMLSFIGCWFPFFTLYLVSSLAGFPVNRFVFATFFWLGYFNSALNPISYAAFNQDFRAAFKRLLKMK